MRHRAPTPAVIPAEYPPGPGSWIDEVTRRRVIVHTKDDKSYRGLLIAGYSDGVVLAGAELLGRETTPLAGDLFVPRGNVHSIQTDA